MLTLLLATALTWTCCTAASSGWKTGNNVHVEAFAGGTFATGPADWRYVDGFGRERLFHGLNVVYKSAPYIPLIDAFDAVFDKPRLTARYPREGWEGQPSARRWLLRGNGRTIFKTQCSLVSDFFL